MQLSSSFSFAAIYKVKEYLETIYLFNALDVDDIIALKGMMKVTLFFNHFIYIREKYISSILDNPEKLDVVDI